MFRLNIYIIYGPSEIIVKCETETLVVVVGVHLPQTKSYIFTTIYAHVIKMLKHNKEISISDLT